MEKIKEEFEETKMEDIKTQAQIEAQKEIEAKNILISIIARTEAVEILVELVNRILNVTQPSENKVSDDIIQAVQDTINLETNKTKELYDQLNLLMNGENANETNIIDPEQE